ncbi:endo-beta-N-acetylglucosaminidase [Arcanobacterium haemolyticum]
MHSPQRHTHRIIPKTLAASLAIALGLIAAPAYAADTVYNTGDKEVGTAQPKNMGHRLQDVRDWSPETDPYAPFLRADVPLQKRIDHDPTTQADPNLDGKAEIMLMQGDYGNSFFDNFRANNDANQHTLQFWQYADYWSPWHGSASVGTPRALYDPKTSKWQQRGFEFGIVDIPNPAWTNAAHRNGVKSIATIYFDPAFRPALTYREAFEKDKDSKEYRIAKQLVEMAKYYGYDGYFLNEEEGNLGSESEELRPLMQYLTRQGLYTQWYSNIGANWDSHKEKWTGLGDDKVMDSVFLNYRWNSSSAKGIAEKAKEKGYDPHKRVFFGVEANQAQLTNKHTTAKDIPGLYTSTDNHSPTASIALFTPSDYYHRGLDDDFKNISDPTNPVHQRDGFQWMVDARQRLYFSGGAKNPAKAEFGSKAKIDDVTSSSQMEWGGVADFVPARSVIRGNSFSTNFNIGRGLQWWSRGQLTSSEQWANMDSQSILPSWQWWVESEDSNVSLTADWDLGDTEKRFAKDGRTEVPLPFKAIGAYDGGSSLAIHGSSSKPATLNLFKTHVNITDKSQLNLVTQQASSSTAKVSLVVQFADSKEEIIPVTNILRGTWNISNVDLSKFAGKTATSIGLRFEDAKDYQLNLGSLSLTSGAGKPDAPSGVKIDRVYDDGQLVLSWDKAEYGDVVNYRVTALEETGESHLYEGFSHLVYVKKAPIGKVTYRVQAVGADGQFSDPVDIPVDMTKAPRGLAVASREVAEVSVAANKIKGTEALRTVAEGKESLTVSWDGSQISDDDPCLVVAHLQHRESGQLNDFSSVVPCASGKATVSIPVREGYPVDVTVRPQSLSYGVSVRADSADSLARPLPDSDLKIEGGKYRFFNPSTTDWAGLEVNWRDKDGKETAKTVHLRGDTIKSQWESHPKSDSIVQWRELPAQEGIFVTKLTDTAGNVTTQEWTIKDGALVSVVSDQKEAKPTMADIYSPGYEPVSLKQGEEKRVSLQYAKLLALPEGTTFTAREMPAFASVDKTSGDLILAGDAKPGHYQGTIDVVYTDGSRDVALVTFVVDKAEMAPTPRPSDPSPAPKPTPTPEKPKSVHETRHKTKENNLAKTGISIGGIGLIAVGLIAAGGAIRRSR